MAGLWKPNRPGDGPYHINNYYAPLPIEYDYHNILDRVDYIHSEKLRFYGRYSKLWTPVTTSNPTGSEFFVSDRGSQRDATSYSGDAVYMVSPSTVININGTYHSFVDASSFDSNYAEGGVGEDLAELRFLQADFRRSPYSGAAAAHVDHGREQQRVLGVHGTARRLLGSAARRR